MCDPKINEVVRQLDLRLHLASSPMLQELQICARSAAAVQISFSQLRGFSPEPKEILNF